MTDAKLTYPKNSLRKALNAPGAISGVEALRTAARNLDLHRRVFDGGR